MQTKKFRRKWIVQEVAQNKFQLTSTISKINLQQLCF